MPSKTHFCRKLVIILIGLPLVWVANIGAAIDIVLLLDTNGHRWQQQSPARLTEVYAEMIGNFDSQSQFAILAFDAHTEMTIPLSYIPMDASDFISTRTKRIDYRSKARNTAAAIERSIDLLKGRNKKNPAAIVLISSGPISTGSTNHDADLTRWINELLIADAVAANITVHGIFATNATTGELALLQHLTSATGGKYQRAIDINSLSLAMTNITNHLLTNKHPTGQLQSKIVTQTTPIFIPSGSSSKNTPIAVQSEGSISGIQIYIPDEAILPASTSDFPKRLSPSSTETQPETHAKQSLLTWVISSLILVSILIGVFLSIFFHRSKTARQNIEDKSSASYPEDAWLHDVKCVSGTEWHDLASRITLIGGYSGTNTANMAYIFLDDDLISRDHATVEQKSGGYWIKDRGSANGTFINDKIIGQEQRLQNNDQIRFAYLEFVFTLNGPNLVVKTQTPPIEEDITVPMPALKRKIDIE